MEETAPNWGRDERDLLVELKTEMAGVRSDIQDLKTGVVDRLAKEKADKKDVEELQHKVNNDIDGRLRKVEQTSAKYMLTLALFTAASVSMIGLILYHIFQKNV